MEYYKNLDLKDVIYFCEFDLIWKTEQWKDYVGYNDVYQISDLGRVKSLKNNKFRILKQSLGSHGYLIASFCLNDLKKTKTIHKMVAESFLNHIPSKHLFVINHKDHNKLNNSKTNLEIITQRQNTDKNHLKSSSKYVGVYWCKDQKKWRSSIIVNRKRKNLGRFENEEDANNAYQKELNKII